MDHDDSPPDRWQPSPEDLQSFQAHIRSFLEARSWSQNHLEDGAGLSKGMLSKLFSGKLRLTRKHLMEMAKVLELSEEELVRGTPFEAMLTEPVPTADAEALQAAHARITELEQTVAALRAENTEVRRDQDMQQQQFTGLREQLRGADSAKKASEDLAARQKAELKEARDELAKQRKELASMAEEREGLRVSMSLVTKRLEAVQSERDVLRAENDKAVRALDVEKAERAKLRDQVAALRKEKERALAELNDANAIAADARSEVARERAIAKTAKEQAQEWAKHAAAETSRAEQLEALLRDLQARAREETATLMKQLTNARQEVSTAVSPGAAFLTAVLAAGAGAVLGGAAASESRKSRRRY